MAKHTDGPWKVGPTPTAIYAGDRAVGTAYFDASVPESRDEAIANATLMAASLEMRHALDRIFSFVSYVNIHGVGEQPEPRTDGQPQPAKVAPDEFARIFQEIGRLSSTALAKAEGAA